MLFRSAYPHLEGTTTNSYLPNAKYTGILFSYSPACNGQMCADNFSVIGEAATITDPDSLKDNNAGRHAIVFTELMPDPNPTIALPDCEYIEIYNRTDSAINLANWKLYGNNSAGTIKSGIIEPYSYALLCTASAVELLQPFGNVITVTSFQIGRAHV